MAALSGLAVYAVLFAGWTSNSKYAFLGGCRSSAGMISYELPRTMIVLTLASLVRDPGMHSLPLGSLTIQPEPGIRAIAIGPSGYTGGPSMG